MTKCAYISILVAAATAWPGILLAVSPDTVWTGSYGGADIDCAQAVEQTSDGGYILTGYTYSFDESGDAYVVKTDSKGNPVWMKTYGGSSYDEGWGVLQTVYGDYLIAGRTYSFGAGGADVYLIKIDTNGDTVWTRTYGGPGFDQAMGVVDAGAGGYIIAGYTDSFTGDFAEIYLICTGSDGDSIWTRAYGGTGDYRAYDIDQAWGGGHIIAGEASFGSWSDVYLMNVDYNGDTLWTRAYGGTDEDVGMSVRRTVDFGYIVAGYTKTPSNGVAVYLVKTDANGDSVWTRSYGGGGFHVIDLAYSVDESPDGGYVVTGISQTFGGGGLFLMKVDSQGDTLWTAAYNGLAGYSVRRTDDDGYIIAGEVPALVDDRDASLVKIEGERPAITSITDVSNDQGRQVTVSWHRSSFDAPLDTVAITGYSLWRRVDDLPITYSQTAAISARSEEPLIYPPGNWHYVLTVPARGENTYNCVAPTLCDSTANGMHWSVFFVSAVTPDPLIYFDSNPDSGYSVDNLAPAPPANLQMPSPVELAWSPSEDEDFKYFSAYGSDAPDFTEDAILIDYTIDTSMDVSGESYSYYHVTATDFAGNEGEPSSVQNHYAGAVHVDEATDDCLVKLISPNPFAATATITFHVSEVVPVTMAVFDVQGKMVKHLIDSTAGAGRHSVTWMAHDDSGKPVGPGVYFIHIEAGQRVATAMVVVVR